MPRWACCDVRDKGKFGSTGCRSRCHMAPEDDKDYEAAIDAKNGYFAKNFVALSDEIEEIKKADWGLVARMNKQDQLREIKAGVEEERKVIKRFDNLELSQDEAQNLLAQYYVNPITGEVERH